MDLDALLARMTLDEKLAQLGCVWCSGLVRDDGFSREGAIAGSRTASARSRASARRPDCVRANAPSSRTRSSATSSKTPGWASPPSCTKRAPRVCAHATPRSSRRRSGSRRPGIPISSNASATVIREQMVATGARHTLAPVLDIARDPRWGRVEETYGESPYLTARLGVAYVRGVQGDLDRPASPRRASTSSATRCRRAGSTTRPCTSAPRELREVYAEPFRAAIAEAGLATVMNSYSSVDGLPCGEFARDPRRPAARRARVHRGGRRRLLDDRMADHAPPRRGRQGRGRAARVGSRSRHGVAATRLLRRAAEGTHRSRAGRRRRSSTGRCDARWS